ncbi:glycosyltransferase [Treponema endosymbiont of Eucomonympha sp.]|uniref:glycosyltransferase n=1 Tax=Treponema endosymbiont of Eucomonympha sp. TaxID=1580831 RepID=UPI000AECAC5B|nr:glycosyltransferase [Treponema endosymbiont of Eucomonympha sp.]
MSENAKGISVITCSINQKQCEQMHNSIKDTIGLPFEFISFDNREKHWGICKVYNHCAQEVKYPYLCFIHEDVIMGGSDWGKIIVEFIENTPNCGVIGFAGGLDAPKNFLRWWDGEKRMNVHDTYIDGYGSDLISKYRARHFSILLMNRFHRFYVLTGCV